MPEKLWPRISLKIRNRKQDHQSWVSLCLESMKNGDLEVVWRNWNQSEQTDSSFLQTRAPGEERNKP